MNLKKLVSIGLSFLFAAAIPVFSSPVSLATNEEEIEVAIEQQNEEIERLESKIENIKSKNAENIETLKKEVKKIKKKLEKVEDSKSGGRGFFEAVIKKTSAAGVVFTTSYALLTSTDTGNNMTRRFAQGLISLSTILDPPVHVTRRSWIWNLQNGDLTECESVNPLPDIGRFLGSSIGAAVNNIESALALSAIAALCAFVFA